MTTGATVIGIRLLVDAHATTTALPTWAIAVGATGAGAAATGFVCGTDMSTLSTVVRIGLGVGTGITTAVGGIAGTAGAITFLAAIGADAGAIGAGFIRAAGMPTRTAVAGIGLLVDAVTTTLGLPAWTYTLAIGTDLVGATDMPTGATVAGIASQVSAGALTATAATALAIGVAADAVGFTIGKGRTDTS